MNALSEKHSTETQTKFVQPVVEDKIHLPTPRPVQRDVSEAMSLSNPMKGRKEAQKHQNGTVSSEDTGQEATKASRDEWVEHDEPGVYITLISLPNGQKGLKRVRFR